MDSSGLLGRWLRCVIAVEVVAHLELQVHPSAGQWLLGSSSVFLLQQSPAPGLGMEPPCQQCGHQVPAVLSLRPYQSTMRPQVAWGLMPFLSTMGTLTPGHASLSAAWQVLW